MFAAIRVLNRLELVAETLRAALNAVATVAPAWLQVRPLAWYERYGKRIEDTRLPQGQASRDAYAQMVGRMASTSWMPWRPPTPPGGPGVTDLESLRRTWQRHYERTVEEARAAGDSAKPRVRFKAIGNYHQRPSIESPYDADARYRHKRDTSWTGYMVHVSETCEPLSPTSSRTSIQPLPPSMRRSARLPSSRP